MDEPTPTVLDYVKAKLTPWRGPAPAIPKRDAEDLEADGGHASASAMPPETSVDITADTPLAKAEGQVPPVAEAGAFTLTGLSTLPWRSVLAVFLAILGQRALEPPDRSVPLGIAFYLLGIGFLLWSYRRGEWTVPRVPERPYQSWPISIRVSAFLLSAIFLVAAFLTFNENRFTALNVLLWSLALAALIWAFWGPVAVDQRWFQRLRSRLSQPSWGLTISPWWIALILVAGAAIFFRLYQLDQVPPEMFSDHAEKLTDVGEVIQGQYSIFFPRNTGREAFQMYLTAAVAQIFNTGLSFMSLKIGTALAGLVTLPFIYLIGKEAGNRTIGLYALGFAAIAYWPNVISRVALRFSLYPLFAAPTIYFMIRGLKTGQRRYFIFTGIALGLGLHGYSPFRLVPLMVLATFIIYLLHRQSEGRRQNAIFGLIIVVMISFVIFLPLFRYAVDEPEMFFFRSFSRLGSTERDLPGTPFSIFLGNSWVALIMFFWSNGETWVHSIVHRPALDLVSAALFGLGILLVVLRYGRDRHWLDLTLLVSIPLLLLPSILSIAFPAENPSLNRTAGALIPVFVIVGIALEGLMTSFKNTIQGPWGIRMAWAIGILLLLWSAFLNYDLVFNQYFRQFQLGAWNTSEIGFVIRSFANSVGDRDSAWVVPSPHWVDTRLVGINAGFPEKDYALWPENLADSQAVAGPKLFIIRPDNQEGMAVLRELYPAGVMDTYRSSVESKDFLIYFVPP